MISFPNAKINLGLHVTEKRTDGYHNIDSCFYPVPIKDALEVLKAKDDGISISGLEVAGDKYDNLIWTAYKLLKADFNIDSISVHLLKKIPMGAGMGGGSADGAFMLKMLNSLFELNLSKKQLEHYALKLGSDCPFFIENTPKYVTGRGEILAPIQVDLSGYWLGLIFPNLHISTAEAYGGIKPNAERKSVKEIIENQPIEQWKDILANDFEQSIFANHPELMAYKKFLYENNTIYTSMTGSGSTLYAIFNKKEQLDVIDQWISL